MHPVPVLQQPKAMAAGGGALCGARPDESRRTKRLQKELARLWSDPPEWCAPCAADARSDLFHWRVVVVGPQGSPYDGGVFAVRIKFPRDYPFKAPKVVFETKVYHPNIDPRTGLVCLDFLTDKRLWTSAWTVDRILLVVASLLQEPVMDGGAINPEAAYLYKKKRLRYAEIAREMTRQHASSAPASASASASSPHEPPPSSEKERHPPPSRDVSLCRRLMRRVAFLRTSG